MSKLTKEEFVAEVKDTADELRKAHPELRKGQAIFDVIDSNIKYLRAARTTQQQYQVDCFYLDDKIEDFLDTCYEVYSMRYNILNTI